MIAEIREILSGLESWRVEHGWAGPDQYHPEESLLHPMTLGAWGRAYAVLSQNEFPLRGNP